MTIRI
jgi:hypothetical protein